MASYKGTLEIEYTFGPEDGSDPQRKFVIDVPYTVTFGHPGKMYGPPENCYPPEGDDVEFGVPTIVERDPKDATNFLYVAPSIAEFLLRNWDAAPYIDAAIDDARDGRDSLICAAAEREADRRREDMEERP